MDLFSSWEGVSTKVHLSDNQNGIFSSTSQKKEKKKKNKKRAFQNLQLGNTWFYFPWVKQLFPRIFFFFSKKKSFHWKTIPMENAWPWLQRIGPLASVRGRWMPWSVDLVCHSSLAQSWAKCFCSPWCYFSSSLSASIDCPHFRAGTVSHSMLHAAYLNMCLLTFSTAVTTVFSPPTAASSQYRDEEKSTTYGCNALLIKHYCIPWGCGGRCLFISELVRVYTHKIRQLYSPVLWSVFQAARNKAGKKGGRGHLLCL